MSCSPWKVVFMHYLYTFGEDNSFKVVLSLFWKRVSSKRKEFAPTGSKFFPFRVDTFPEGVSCAGKQTGRHKSYLPCKKNSRKAIKHINSP